MKLNKEKIEEAKKHDKVCIERDMGSLKTIKILELIFLAGKEQVKLICGDPKFFYTNLINRHCFDSSDKKPKYNYTHYKVTDFYEPEIKTGDLVLVRDNTADHFHCDPEVFIGMSPDGRYVCESINMGFLRHWDEVKPYKEDVPEYTWEEAIKNLHPWQFDALIKNIKEHIGHEFKIKKQ